MFVRVISTASLMVILLSVAGLGAESDVRLTEAAKSGNWMAVRSLLQQRVEVNAPGVDGTTALHWAVRADDLETAELLIRAGANVKATDPHGVTPIYLACVNGIAAMIRMLLDAGADPNSANATGETALMTAVRTGNLDSLRVLLDRGAVVNAKDTEFEQTALMWAVRENHPAAVKLLIEHRADVNARTRTGPTPLFIPPCKGTGCGAQGVGIIRGGLPEQGTRAPIAGAMTPLLYAARDGGLDTARMLVAAGADVKQTEANGISPLLMAIINNHMELAKFLLDRGADPNAADFWGRAALWAAVDVRDMNVDSSLENGVDRAPVLELIKTLLDHGANPDARTKEVPPVRMWMHRVGPGDLSWVDFTGQTPFFWAAFTGDTNLMHLLLSYGADPNIPTFAGTTPLMAAAGVNWVVMQTYTESKEALLEAVKICLSKGADVNAANSMGLTALHGAANRGSDDIIKFLVEKGARLDVKDKEGRTPLTWAQGVFLASHAPLPKPSTIALIQKLMGTSAGGQN